MSPNPVRGLVADAAHGLVRGRVLQHSIRSRLTLTHAVGPADDDTLPQDLQLFRNAPAERIVESAP